MTITTGIDRPPRLALGAGAAALLLALLLLLGLAAQADAAVVWEPVAISNSTAAPGGTHAYLIDVRNVGDEATNSSTVKVTATLPPGITGASFTSNVTGAFDCPGISGASTVVCSGTPFIGVPSGSIALTLVTNVKAGISGVRTARFDVEGGGAPLAAHTVDPVTITTAPPAFGIAAFDGLASDAAGNPLTQAGEHPDSFTTSFDLDTHTNPSKVVEGAWPVEDAKDIVVDLPTGFVGNPASLARCTVAELANSFTIQPEPLCSPISQIGVVDVRIGGGVIGPVPVFNMTPPPGAPARFGFNVAGSVVLLDAEVRNGGDYGLRVRSTNVPQALAIGGTTFTFWGVPSDPSHDGQRACAGMKTPAEGGPTCASGAPPVAFFRNPTSCSGPAALTTTLSADSWQHPGTFVHASFAAHLPPGYPYPEGEWGAQVGTTGCGAVPFTPAFEAQPTTTQADSPTGLAVTLTMPQQALAEPSATSQADVRRTVVTLPDGMTIDPSQAQGLEACSLAQIGYLGNTFPAPFRMHFTPGEPSCPDASKIGSVEVQTPLLSQPLKGSVYLAAQGSQNPFGTLLSLYIVAQGQGVVIKLPGRIDLDPATGRLTTTIDDAPQTPFTKFSLQFDSGPRAPLVNPPGCGTKTIEATIEGWNGSTVSTPSTYTVPCTPGLGGFAPSFAAGTASPQAGAFSPFGLSFARGDGEQRFRGLTSTLPPGAAAMLNGVPRCSDADASAGTCPAASRIGSVSVTSGAGSNPFPLTGNVYLTGPYNGGPFGEVAVIPLIAGPLDLGTEVIRGSIRIDPTTAQAIVVSDPLPQMVKQTGIPADVRRIDVTLDRPGFSFNPTSCAELHATSTLTSAQGASVPLSTRFQAADCASLTFKPKFSASTAGSTSKANGASFHVHLASNEGPHGTGGAGESNIAKVDVQLPVSLPARLTTLQKACTAAQFASNPAGCPAASFVGTATAHTPILTSALSGPAILVSHGGQAFPDLVLVLQGEGVRLNLTGHTQIKKGITFSHFETVPDAPVASFDLTLPQGPHSALTTDIPGRNLCANTRTVTVTKRVTRRVHGHTRKVTVRARKSISTALLMPTTITAQNGAVIHQNTNIAVTGCPKAKVVKHKTKKRRK